MYNGYITTLKNVRPHPNADRLVLADCFGNTICVSNNYEEGMLCVYFPTDGQLSVEFCQQNNLLRLKDENGHSIPGGGYMDPDKRNVSAIRLRGEKSDGLALPISCLDYCFEDGAAAHLNIGDTINIVNGYEICKKYIPRGKKQQNVSNGNRTRKKRVNIAPLFAEHADTEQLAYNLNDFKSEDNIEITLKLHGTSQRTGYLPIFKKYKRTLLDRLFKREGTPIYEYDIITGTRRTVIDPKNTDGGFYGDNDFRFNHSELFRGKLWKGETVYYEVVGFLTNGTPIMAECNNKKLNDKEFVKQYGQTTTFSYGCEPHPKTFTGYNDSAPGYQNQPVEVIIPRSDIYVYRMTMTNEDGNIVEYTPDFMRYRCEQIGVKTVPVFWKGIIPEIENDEALPKEHWISPGDYVKELAEEYYEGPDPIGKTHIREGVVVRIINRPKFCAYKHKNFEFKVLENIIKTDAEAPDMEEADGLEEMEVN